METKEVKKEEIKKEKQETWEEAFVKFQAEMPVIKKEKQAFKYKYAPLDVIMSAIRPVLAKHGFAIIQTEDLVFNDHEETNDETKAHIYRKEIIALEVITKIIHISGQIRESIYYTAFPGVAEGQNIAQQIQSLKTYARRGGLNAALGIAPEDEDDDGAQLKTEGHHPQIKESPHGYQQVAPVPKPLNPKPVDGRPARNWKA